MKNLLTFFLCILGVYANAQQTISDWKYQKDVSSNPQNFVKAGKKIYFVATTPEHGRELWVTEGTSESTKLVKDIMVGENSSSVQLGSYAALEDGTLYFVASDNPNENPKIWVTDGTEKGTKIYQNEVKGTLFHTGDELLEYKIDEKKGKITIYHQDSKRDSVLTIGNGINTGYSVRSRSNNLLTISLEGSIYGPFYMAMVDLKEQKVKVKSPSLYFQLSYQNITPWKNDIYMTFGNLILRMNSTTGKFDTLSALTLRLNQPKSLTPIRFFPTSNELYLTINEDVYTLRFNRFLLKNKANFYKGAFDNASSYHDSKNDIMYFYKNDDNSKNLTVKGVKLSDGSLVKNFNISYSNYLSNISFTGSSAPKIFLENPNGAFSVIDINTEQIKDFPYIIPYRNSLYFDDKAIFGGSTTKNITDSELYLYDNQTDDVKLLKNINTNGVQAPKVYATTFGGKLIQVYNNEKGIMLGVSDGTKTGTKDLKLLIKDYNNLNLDQVSFQEANQHLGIIIAVRNKVDYSKDSVFCFSVNPKVDDVKTLVARAATTPFYDGAGRFTKIDASNKLLILEFFYSNSFKVTKYLTDLTPENTKGFNNINISEATEKFIYVGIDINNTTPFGNNSYILKYDLLTKKADTIPDSQFFSAMRVFDGKLYFDCYTTGKSYVTDGMGTQELSGVKPIASLFKAKGRTFILDNEISGGTINNKFSIYLLENNVPKRVFTGSASFGLQVTLSPKIWETNGKAYLILNANANETMEFYEIKDDFSLTKVYQIENEYISFSNPNLSFNFKTIETLEILPKGLIFRTFKNNQNIIYCLNNDFQPKEIYRSKVIESISSDKSNTSKTLKFFFASSGSLFVTDGSIEGSKLLIDNNLTGYSYRDGFRILQKNNSTNNSFYFSFFPAALHKVNLWFTDGTQKGTTQLINQKGLNDYSLNQEELGMIGNKFFFKKPNEETGNYEAWTTEGTVATTQKLKDFEGKDVAYRIIGQGTGWTNFLQVNNNLYFSRQTPDYGYEPWQTDGTPEGTKIVGDLVKGIQGSNPYQFVEINQNPYCIANEENKSLQLWALGSLKIKTTIEAEKLSTQSIESIKLFTNENNDWKYQWIKDGKPLESATSPILTTQISGMYQVRVEDKIGHVNFSNSIEVKILQKALANEPLTEDFLLNIYPNPAQDDLNVSFETTSKGDFEATLYDLYGKIVSQQAVSPSTNNSISTKNLNAGTYIFRLSNGEKQSIRKVIKR
jgi:ELWxxDGT repeat protein